MNQWRFSLVVLLVLSACQSKVDQAYSRLSWIEQYLPNPKTSVLDMKAIEPESERRLAIRLLDSLSEFQNDSLADQLWRFYEQNPGHLRAEQMGKLAIAVAESRGQFGSAGIWALSYAAKSGETQVDRLYMRAAAAFEQVGDYGNQLRCLDSASRLSADSNVRASSLVVAELIRAGALSAEEQLELLLSKQGKTLSDDQ
jgi:hypothetical protein